MKQKIVLFILSLLFYTNIFAEGQDALGTFIAIFYVLSILFYTLVLFFMIKLFLKLSRLNDPYSVWFYIAISFFTSLLLILIVGDNSIPFFW